MVMSRPTEAYAVHHCCFRPKPPQVACGGAFVACGWAVSQDQRMQTSTDAHLTVARCPVKVINQFKSVAFDIIWLCRYQFRDTVVCFSVWLDAFLVEGGVVVR